jgi:chromosome segregation ATPase
METKNYVSIVKSLKATGRDFLRIDLIKARLSKIAGLESDIKGINECIANMEKELAQTKYDLSKVDTANPSCDDLTATYNQIVKDLLLEIEEHNKAIADIQLEIKDQQEGITKIETGETKVSIDKLNSYVDEVLKDLSITAGIDSVKDLVK